MKRTDGNNHSEFNLMEGLKGKVKLVSAGKFNIMVVTDENKIYRVGYSKEGHLGVNETYNKLTIFEKVEDEE